MTRKCAFISSRACPIDVEEIPLDVCKLCIDAWKTSAEIQSLTGANVLGPTLMVPVGQQPIPVMPGIPSLHPESSSGPAVSAPPSKPLTLIPSGIGGGAEQDETQNMLHRLDVDFINDKITADEYVEQRRAIVNQLATEKDTKKPTLLAKATQDGYLEPEDSMPAGPPEDYFKVIDLNLERDIRGYHNALPLILIERRMGKIGIKKYPENWSVPKSINRSNLESVYDLYDELRENQEKIILQFNGTKLGILGKKNNKILCFVIGSDEKVETYHDELAKISDLLETSNDFDDFMKTLPEAMSKTKDLSFN
ncbi:MAG: hypothetical protein NWF07_11085 [Candidatus Bathyarchaeota archaeon]|nr:hypothetical protein [Candidatus Bathyarchaeota archaeon]